MATKIVSVLTGGTNNHSTTSEEVNAIATDILSDGVVGAISATSGVAPTTGSFAVNAQGTPNMTVRVSAGQAYVTGTPTSGNSQRVRVSMATYEDVVIAANSTGGTRYDHIYIALDAAKMKDPAVDASDVATLVASRSTSSSTDNGTPPTYGYKLAVVTVANGASSIANASIADSRSQTGATALSLIDGIVTPEDLVSGTGTSWGWTSYTPTLTNVTTGNGTLSAYYKQIGKTLVVKGSFTLGSSSSISGQITITHPVTTTTTGLVNEANFGGGSCIDSGTDIYPVFLYFGSSTSFKLVAINAASTYARTTSSGVVSGTVPFTFSTGDSFTWHYIAEAA